MMLENIVARKKRRPIILGGISQDLKHSEISAQLRTNGWVITRDIKFMRHNGDIGLKQAEEARARIRKKRSLILAEKKEHYLQNKRFLGMTGITLREKSFRNMIDFNKLKLMNILKSEDQNAEIIKLPRNIRKTLRKNGIITERWQDNEITERAQEYLTNKSPAREL